MSSSYSTSPDHPHPQATYYPPAPPEYAHPHPPAPGFPTPAQALGPVLNSALAVSGPRWVPAEPQTPLYPPTPSVPFPLSLNHRDVDPFSRAVSPIHGHGGLGGGGGKSGAGMGELDLALLTRELEGHVEGHGTADGGANHLFTAEYSPFDQAFPTPPSPNKQEQENTQIPSQSWPSFPSLPTDNLTPPDPTYPTAHHTSDPPTQLQSPMFSGSYQSPVLPLAKIRRPSLRTLLSTGGSQAGSRPQSPSPHLAMPSPTLFDQPMQMDEEVAGEDGFGGLPLAMAAQEGRMEGFEMGYEHGQRQGQGQSQGQV